MSIPQLVSVIIPCFNAEQWLREAIESILAQTYPQIEIIVIDDGSSDRSLAIIQSYGEKLIWRTGKNQGANKARNLGFTLSQGEYIQYLDADDYLLPDKIAKQVQTLQATTADFVYSDWRYQHHLDRGHFYLDRIQVCGVKTDFLESLLSNDRWSNLAPILFTRSIINRVSWDESLKAAQDRDFLISVMLANAQPVYQPGCDSIYRMHSATTVSTTSKLRWLQAHCLVMEKAEKQLAATNRLSVKYKQALATAYWSMGKEYLYSNFRIKNKYSYYKAILDKVYALSPNLLLKNKSLLYKIFYSLIGYQATEKLSYFFYNSKRKINHK